MSEQYELNAELRDAKGTSASRRLRETSRIPGIIYGGGKAPTSVSFDHDAIYHQLEHESFHSSILTVKTGKESEQAILRDVQMHPYKQLVMHMDLQRISATDKIHMSVPLHFTGAEVAPGVKEEGGMVSHLMTEVDITCLASNLPEFLTIDVSGLHIGDSIHLSEIQLPEGVEITTLGHGGDDQGVVTVSAIRVQVEEEVAPAEGEGEEGAAPAEGEGEEGAAPAEGEKKEGEKKEGK